jgi:hypothetical protein
VRAVRYEPGHRDAWNRFVAVSRNGTFLFHRGYMEYHHDRFQDHSLLFFDERDRLVGLLPASRHDDVVISHGGLTYGGVIIDAEMKTAAMLNLFETMLTFLNRGGLRTFVYKPVPHIFHVLPAEEDLYALFRNNARLYRRDASSAVWLPGRLKFAKGKREGVRKAGRAGLVVEDADDFATFFALGRAVMRDRHNLQPVHSDAEMALLAGRFPEQIRLHGAFAGERMLAGAIVFRFAEAAHVQYMYNSDEGLGVGALDIVIDHVVNDRYTDLRYLSFGVSSEDDGWFLNEGLAHQKEMFGARAVVHDFYEMDLT